jgi:hypothetical protein
MIDYYNKSFFHRALASAQLARLAYWDREGGWEAVKEKLEGYGFTRIRRIENQETDTQLIIASNSVHVCLVFRGTEKKQDWNTNLNLSFFRLWGRERKERKRIKSVMKKLGMGSVHFGFFTALESVIDDVISELEQIRGKKLWVVGHSLGGALANLAALALSNRGFVIYGLFTFGAPRVGWRSFAKRFKKLIHRSAQFVNANDLVPKIPPPVFGYVHIGKRYYLTTDGKIKLNTKYFRDFKDRNKSRAADGYSGTQDHAINSEEFGYISKLKDLVDPKT